VLFSEYADQNIWNALAFALIGGLASSTFFVLTVSPAIYLMFERRPERKRLLAAGGVELAVAAGAMRAPGERLSWKERARRAGRAAVAAPSAVVAGGRWAWRHVPRRHKRDTESDDS
jgi:apolipoprotein N-acyltransferase